MNQSYQGKITTSIKYVVIAMSMMVAVSTSQADVSQKKIGDLEIYKAAEGGKVTIMMMLDTSGSMSEPYMKTYFGTAESPTACNLPKNTPYTSWGGGAYNSTKSGSNAKFNQYGCTIADTTKNVLKYFLNNEQKVTTTETTKIYVGKYRKRTYSCFLFFCGWSNWSSVQPSMTFTSTNQTSNTNGTTWYGCGADGSVNRSDCTTTATNTTTTGMTSETVNGTSSSTSTAPIVTNEATTTFTDPDDSNVQYEIQNPQVTTTTKTINQTNNVYWKKMVTEVDKAGGNIPDRLTSLKIAIFKLLDNGGLDPDKVAIGIGQYSSQTDADNTTKLYPPNSSVQGDNKTGKILVPAAKLDSTQIETLKNAVAGLIGTGGTPTANAYAESGAYMLATNTTNSSYSAYSGFDRSVSSSKNNLVYKSPLTGLTGQCNGQGIYFLTDGYPNNSSSDIANTIMSKSLNVTSISPDTGLINVTNGNDSATVKAWDYIGAYAKKLRDTANPIRMTIKTATVGFGSEFNNSNGLPTKKITIGGEEVNVTDCDQLSTQDAINLCKWGEKSYNYGEGGFYSAQSTDDVVDSIIKFAKDLNQTLPSAPSGTIVIPDDPYRADSQLAVAYYPILQADLKNNVATWAGNLKKYNLNEGTLYGKNNSSLFLDIAGNLNPTTEDLWSAVSVVKDGVNANDLVTSGGFYSNLRAPNTAVNNVRTLYIEDNTSSSDTSPRLRKLGVNASGKVTLDGSIISTSNTFVDTTTYSRTNVNLLLQFLGFTLTDAQKTQALADLVLTAPASPVKVLGATIHSTPSMVSYSADLDTDGKVSSTRDDYALFGSSDGSLHMVNADDYTATGNGGREQLAFIPKQMLISQPQALINGTSTDVGKPYFGVDAPWLVSANYFYDLDNSKVTVTPCAADTTIDPSNTRDCRNTYVRAYGGLRMGGEGMYGLDLTDKNNPKMLFRIDSATTGFDRMGQIWSKPTKAKIATGIDSTTKKVNAYKDVLIFGGGYDTCYEDQGYQVGTTTSTLSNQKSQACNRTTATESLGNAVYMVDAKTGALIWSATKTANAVSGATNTTVSTLNNSIVGGITVLDRNNDGYMDQLYFADMGGQLFRADFTNAGFIKPVSSGTAAPENSFSNTRVVRLLQPTFTGVDIKYNHRFYERPAVSFYRGDSSFNNSRLFAVVNVISGDRSSPLSKLRASDAYADRLYGIMDTDVTLADSILYASDFTTRKESTATDAPKVQKVVDLNANTTTASDLLALPTVTTDYTLTTKRSAITSVKAKRGWYYPLTRFDGFNQVKYTKGVGKSEVIDNFLYTTVYNPDMTYGTVNPCVAKITGGSERQLYCLPYGICLKETTNSAGAAIDEYATSKNGTAGFARAGQGIQELTLGPRSSTLSNQRLLIGTQTITDRASNRVNFGDDSGKLLADDTGSNNIGLDRISQPLSGLSKTTGDGSAPENIYNDRYTLKPNTWFEVNK